MSWRGVLKSVSNVFNPGAWDKDEMLFGFFKGAWDDFTGKSAIDKQNEYNMRMWQMQNEYNTPANQMKRYLEAGLNPNLIYSQGNAGNASSAPEMTAHQGSFAKALELGKLVLTLKQMAAQNRNLNAQTDNIKSQTAMHTADVDYKMALIDFYNKHGFFPNQSNAPVNIVKEVMNSSPIQKAEEGLSTFLGNVVGHAFYGPELEFGEGRARSMAVEAAKRKGLRGAEFDDYVNKFLKIYKATH